MEHRPFSYVHLPKGVKSLIIISVVVYLGQLIVPGSLERFFSLVPKETLFSLQIWRAISYLFLHGSFFHILLNLFMLWSFGKELEFLWGTYEFIKYFFICGIGAALFNLVLDPFSQAQVIGSSGAIYGLLVAFAMNFPNAIIYLYALIPVRVKHFVILLCAIEFLASFNGTTPIARFAHLGGIVIGFAYLRHFSFRSLMDKLFFRMKKNLYIKAVRTTVRDEKIDLAQEVDKILEKVLKSGPGSLTDKERDVMRRYSERKKF